MNNRSFKKKKKNYISFYKNYIIIIIIWVILVNCIRKNIFKDWFIEKSY